MGRPLPYGKNRGIVPWAIAAVWEGIRRNIAQLPINVTKNFQSQPLAFFKLRRLRGV